MLQRKLEKRHDLFARGLAWRCYFLHRLRGCGARHLRWLCRRYLGAPPVALASRRRVQRARALLERTRMSIAAVAFAAGFSSIRRFNAAFVEAYGYGSAVGRPRGAVESRL